MDLNAQLRQHEIELRHEKQQEKQSVAQKKQEPENAPKGKQAAGMSQGSMEAMISANRAVGQAEVQQNMVGTMKASPVPFPCLQRAPAIVSVRLQSVPGCFCLPGQPQSTKQDEEQHGFGLANIRRVAQKYYGDVDIVQEGERVRLNVMLMLRTEEKDT